MNKSERKMIQEILGQLKEQAEKIQSLECSNPKQLEKIKFVNVFFDLDKYKQGQDEINRFLNDGFEITRDFQTEAGLVYCLGKFKDKNERKYGAMN